MTTALFRSPRPAAFACLALAWLVVLAALSPPAATALDVPKLKGRVNDLAGMLDAQTAARIEAELAAFEASDSTQVVVLTIPSLEGENIEEYAIKTAQGWGLGQKGKDNGVLLLVAKNDRQVRIEVGRGLEGPLTDALAGRIVDQVIVPKFKAGDVPGGVSQGVSSIIAATRGEYKGTGDKGGKDEEDPGVVAVIIVALILGLATRKLPAAIRAGAGGVILPVVGFFLSLSLAAVLFFIPLGIILGLAGPYLFRFGSFRGGGGGFGGFGGGSGGGGGFSGGGGSFGGGGASGRW